MAINPVRPGATSWTPEGSSITYYYDGDPNTPVVISGGATVDSLTSAPSSSGSVLGQMFPIPGINTPIDGSTPPISAGGGVSSGGAKPDTDWWKIIMWILLGILAILSLKWLFKKKK